MLVALVILVPVYAPFVLLGFAISEFIKRAWFSGVVLLACAAVAYLGFQLGARRFMRWAETRRQGESL